jgi:hypothetical protein
MTKSKHDRLLAALIGKLPAEKTPWRRDDRIAWLWMMALAFDVVYGPCGGIRIEAEEVREPSIAVAPSRAVAPPGTASDEHTPPRFYIDRDGFAMSDGRPLAIEELPPDAILWDERSGPECGEVAAILWRDIGTTRRSLPPGVNVQPASEA